MRQRQGIILRKCYIQHTQYGVQNEDKEQHQQQKKDDKLTTVKFFDIDAWFDEIKE